MASAAVQYETGNFIERTALEVRPILQHYDQFDSRYKALLPLKRVFVPELLEEPESHV